MRLSLRDALIATKANSARAWSGSGQSAQARFEQAGLFPIFHQAKFQVDAADRIFTIGSCFAREIESVLVSRGFNILLAQHGIPADRYATWKSSSEQSCQTSLRRDALNKYSVHSMLFSLSMIGQDYEPERSLIELAPGKWFDGQATRLTPCSLPIALDTHKRLIAANAEIRKADVVVITLGLTETWFDDHTGQILNAPPPPQYFEMHKDRFAVDNPNTAELKECLRKVIEVIRHLSGSAVRIIISVSPVPLGATFSGKDIVTANAASKAKLRSIAEEVCDAEDRVDYFPSYEMVTHSPRGFAVMPDGVHIQPQAVQEVIAAFVAAYCGSGDEVKRC